MCIRDQDAGKLAVQGWESINEIVLGGALSTLQAEMHMPLDEAKSDQPVRQIIIPFNVKFI